MSLGKAIQKNKDRHLFSSIMARTVGPKGHN